jgi:hypothetical protein
MQRRRFGREFKGERLILERIATRYDRSANSVFSTICFAAAVVFGL